MSWMTTATKRERVQSTQGETRIFQSPSDDRYYKEEWVDNFADIDRVASDRYMITLTLQGNKHGYFTGCLVSQGQLGLAAYVEYWYYEQNELNKARKTFQTIKDRMLKVKEEIEVEKLPYALIRPFFTKAVRDVDVEHKERSGVANFNEFMVTDVEKDWRETIYGPRYPDIRKPSSLGDGWINLDEESQSVETKGTGRKKVYKTKRGNS